MLKRPRLNTASSFLSVRRTPRKRRRNADAHPSPSPRLLSAPTKPILRRCCEDLSHSQHSRLFIHQIYSRMNLTLEFCGGAETAHAKGEKLIPLAVEGSPGSLTVKDIFHKIRTENVSLFSRLCIVVDHDLKIYRSYKMWIT